MSAAQRALWMIGLVATVATASAADIAEREDYERVPMPAGFQVIWNEVEGSVFADAQGRTLYRWPFHDLRNGDVGEERGKPTCDDHVYTENSGLMSPYPPGLRLPDADTRSSCAQVWPPVFAGNDAKPIGRWSVVTRADGRKQWAYEGYALYTSILDKRPGDVLGNPTRHMQYDSPGFREPIAPPVNIPPGFNMIRVATGHLIVDHDGQSVYTWDNDRPNKSNCEASCLAEWKPVLAPEFAETTSEWTKIERSPGIKQWAFRKRPLYTHVTDHKQRSYEGSDVPGWHNVYTQHAPTPPKEFTVQDTRSGQVLADSHGMTIYIYTCADDALDQLGCDTPDTTQAYRLAVCGGGNADRCLKTFPPVLAAADARSTSRSWSTIDIDAKTGHRAQPGQAGALHVWAYRGRPIYTFAGDHKPGDIRADAWGEFHGKRNGFKAFWLRDDFLENDT